MVDGEVCTLSTKSLVVFVTDILIDRLPGNVLGTRAPSIREVARSLLLHGVEPEYQSGHIVNVRMFWSSLRSPG